MLVYYKDYLDLAVTFIEMDLYPVCRYLSVKPLDVRPQILDIGSERVDVEEGGDDPCEGQGVEVRSHISGIESASGRWAT